MNLSVPVVAGYSELNGYQQGFEGRLLNNLLVGSKFDQRTER
jgi:hypothetical protein